jgi:hypothetical protein
MALEHNLIYFSTRSKAAQEVSSVNEGRQTVSFPISVVRSMSDIRAKADALGLSMPVLLRRMQDPDEIYNIIDDDSYAFVNEKESLNRLSDSVNKVKEKGVQRGTKAPLVASNYYSVLYSSHIRHLEEVEKMRRFRFKNIFAPKWKRINQNVWWPAASVHAEVGKWHTPLSVREGWDTLTKIDPNAPEEYRPFWAMKAAGAVENPPGSGTWEAQPVYETLLEEISERQNAGYRVIFTLADDHAKVSYLENELIRMVEAGLTLPWGVGMWNELDFGHKNTAAELAAKMNGEDLAVKLTNLHNTYGVNVCSPGMSSFMNSVDQSDPVYDYATAIKNEFAGVPGFFFKVHSYGHVQPKYWVGISLKTRIQLAIGQPDAVIVVEETANTFVKEHGQFVDGVIDEQGADYMRAVMYASMQSRLPACHFLLYHNDGRTVGADPPPNHWNDIAHPEYGALRREQFSQVLSKAKATGSVGTADDLILEDPRGREVNIDDYINNLN